MTRRQQGLAGLHDKPEKMIDRAQTQASSDDPLTRRQAAELAHAAAVAAVEKFARREVYGGRDVKGLVAKLDQQAPGFRDIFNGLRKQLHVECHYKGRAEACAKPRVEENVRIARAFVEETLRLAKRGRRIR